jgi:hypothetical protein
MILEMVKTFRGDPCRLRRPKLIVIRVLALVQKILGGVNRLLGVDAPGDLQELYNPVKCWESGVG